jgi:hypothetical protein
MQQKLRLIGEVRNPHLADPEHIEGLRTFRAALRYAVNRSGIDQEAVAEALGIDPASFSRMIREPRNIAARPREFPHEKLPDFYAVTGSYAPLQWACGRAGMEPVSMRETRVQRLERELAEARQAITEAA